MSNAFHFLGHAEKGRLIADDPDSLMVWLSMMEGKKIVGVFHKWYKRRTNQQVRGVHGVWLPILMERLGYWPHEKDQCYYDCKAAFWFEDRLGPDGKMKRVVKETKENDTLKYAEFIKAFHAWALDVHQIDLPDFNPALARI